MNSQPSISGITRSRRIRSGRAPFESVSQRLASVGCFDDVIAGVFEQHREGLAREVVILDDENQRFARGGR